MRAVHASRLVSEIHPEAFDAWKRDNRPLAHLAFVRTILELDRLPRQPSLTDTQPLPILERRPAQPSTPPTGTITVARTGTQPTGSQPTPRSRQGLPRPLASLPPLRPPPSPGGA